MLVLDCIVLEWIALFRVDKIEEKDNHILKMHNISSNLYQSICLLKSTLKI